MQEKVDTTQENKKESLDDGYAILKSVHFKTGCKGLSLVFQEVILWGFPGDAKGTEYCQCRRHKRYRFNPWVRKVCCSKKWHPTPVFLPGKFHGPRNLVGYSPQGRKESDRTERLGLPRWLRG